MALSTIGANQIASLPTGSVDTAQLASNAVTSAINAVMPANINTTDAFLNYNFKISPVTANQFKAFDVNLSFKK